MLRLQLLEAASLQGHMMAMFIVWMPLLALKFGVLPQAFILLLTLRILQVLLWWLMAWSTFSATGF
jgi:hypothetical protein